MKRSIFGAAALALALSASTVQAQRPFSVGVALGATVPTGDLGDGVKTGYHAMLSLGFSPPALPVGVRIDGAFNQFAAKGAGAGDIGLRVLSLTANATFGIPMTMSPISPYIIGGLGMYNNDVTGLPSGSPDIKSETDLGFNVGIGTKFALAGFGTFVEARYHYISGDKAPDGSGGSASYIPLSFGIMF